MSSGQRRGDTAMLGLMWVAVVGLLVSVLLHADRGLDLTDESYYLNAIRSPELYALTVSQFGFIYHPAYEALGGNIALLRAFNAMLVVILAGVLMFRLLAGRPGVDRMWRVTVAAAAGCGALAVFGLGPMTPSYNSLNLTGLLMLAIGVTMVERVFRAASAAGVVIAGTGLFLSFAAKPTAGALAGLSAAVLLLIERRVTWWNALTGLAVTSGLIVVLAYLMDGSVSAFLARLGDASAQLQSLGSGHDTAHLVKRAIRQFLIPDWLNWVSILVLAAVLAGVIVVWALLLRRTGSAARSLAVVIAAAVTGAVLVVSLSGADVRLPAVGRQYVMLGLVVGGSVAWLLTARGRVPRPFLVAWLALLPFMFAFGTNTILWFQASMAGVFWIGALMVPAAGRQIPHILPMAGVSVLAGALIIASAQSVPYRQPGSLNGDLVATDVGGSRLRLDAEWARYLEEVSAVPGLGDQGVIDLTGVTPGALYAANADALGNGWLYGGYKGSAEVAEIFLASVPCQQLAGAWLLTEPGGKRALPDDVAASFGADVEMDYRQVAQLAGPNGLPQYVLAPVRPPAEAQVACERSRG